MNIQQDFIQLLLVPAAIMVVFWWLQAYIARKNRTYTGKFKGSYAVFVAVHHEDPDQLERCLKSITTYGRPLELIVTLDDAPNAPKRIRTIAKSYATRVVDVARRTGKREQYALASEVMRKKPDIIITVSSQAIWDDTTLNILKPFSDDRVGAVVGRHIIAKPHSTWARRIASWLSDARFSVTLPFQSYFGHVHTSQSHTFAVRREVYTAAARAVRAETFAGRRMITADTTSVIMQVLRQGLRVVYQSSSVVTTAANDALKNLARQRLTNYRSEFRGLFRYLHTILRLNPLVWLAYIASLFFSVVLLVFVVTIVSKFVLRVYVLESSAAIAWAVIILATLLLAMILRSLPRFVRSARDLVFLPVFAIFSLFSETVLKVAALLSFSENGLPTRTKGTYGEGKVGRARVVTGVFGLCVIAGSLLLSYFVAIRPLNVPLAVITEGKAPEYTQAYQFAERLKDGDPQNDPAFNQIAELVRANGFTLGYRVNDDFLPLALPCATEKLKTADRKEGNAVLKNIDTCYQQVAADPKLAQEKLNPPKPEPQPIVTVHAHEGDTLTYLVRAEVKKLDTKNELSAAQAVYIETTYLANTQQLDYYMNVNEVANINTEDLKTLVGSAKQLTSEQIAAWEYYASDIIW